MRRRFLKLKQMFQNRNYDLDLGVLFVKKEKKKGSSHASDCRNIWARYFEPIVLLVLTPLHSDSRSSILVVLAIAMKVKHCFQRV
jgi:hypothetical protein